MAPLGFAMLFGNEDKDIWIKFWCFLVSVHPTINHGKKTVITDQDKGLLGSIQDILLLPYSIVLFIVANI